MTQLTRALQKIFGSAGGTSEFGQIGSKAAGAALTTKDLELMQALTEYDDGLEAIISDQGTTKLPYLQDINSLFYLTTSQLAYLMQSGVPEWNDETEYYADVSIVLRNGILYKDVYGTGGTPNLNFAPESNLDKWKAVAAAIDVVSLVDGANISNDASEGSVFTVTIGGDRTFDNWTNKLIGREYTLIITQDGTGNWNPVFDTDFVFYGNDVINQAPGAVTIIKCTVISSSVVSCFIAGGESRAIDFTPKNMKINVTGSDDLTIEADGIQYVNASGETREELVPFVAVWNPSTDIIGGEAGTASQWLQAWRDSDGGMALTLCEVGTTDGTTAGYLDASGNTLFSRGAVAGDYLFNMTTFQVTKIEITPIADNQDVKVVDDIFVNGNGYKLFKNIAPASLGEFAACLGFGFQDSGLDLLNSGYTRPKLQEFPVYAGDHTGNKEFTIGEATTPILSTLIANARLFQELDFSNTPEWRIVYEISYTIAPNPRVNSQLTITSVQYKTGADQVITSFMQVSYLQPPINAEAQSGSNIAIIRHNSATTAQYGFSSNGKYLDYKPAWGTRS